MLLQQKYNMGMLLWGAFDHYCKIKLSRFSSSTRYCYTQRLKHFVANIGVESIKNITTEHIELYIATLLKSGLKPQTVNWIISAIKSFCKWASATYGTNDPASKIEFFKGEPPKQRFIKQPEYEQILRNISGKDRDIIEFLTHTGLRVSEFLELKPTDCEDGFIHIRCGKGNKGRYVPLNKTAKSILDRNLNLPENTINLSKSHYPKSIRRLCLKVAKLAKIEPFSTHALRRYAATRLYDLGVPIEKISRFLGHSFISTTQIYLHHQERELQGLTNCLD